MYTLGYSSPRRFSDLMILYAVLYCGPSPDLANPSVGTAVLPDLQLHNRRFRCKHTVHTELYTAQYSIGHAAWFWTTTPHCILTAAIGHITLLVPLQYSSTQG